MKTLFFLAAGEISLSLVIKMYAGLLLVVIIYFFIRAYVRDRRVRRRNAKYFQS